MMKHKIRGFKKLLQNYSKKKSWDSNSGLWSSKVYAFSDGSAVSGRKAIPWWETPKYKFAQYPKYSANNAISLVSIPALVYMLYYWHYISMLHFI